MKSMKMTLVLLTIALCVMTGCAQRLTMNPPQTLAIHVAEKHAYPVGLFTTKETKEYEYKIVTSPLDSIVYPLGEQTDLLFKQNLPTIFKSVVEVDSPIPNSKVSLVLQPSIVKFAPVVPYPAYNPYTATIIFKVDVYDKKGEKIYSQTATGEGQTSKGMLSGFSAKSLLADAAEMAMNKAMTQILEGLAEAEELKDGGGL